MIFRIPVFQVAEFPFVHEQIRDIPGLFNPSAGIVAKVDNNALRIFLKQLVQIVLEFLFALAGKTIQRNITDTRIKHCAFHLVDIYFAPVDCVGNLFIIADESNINVSSGFSAHNFNRFIQIASINQQILTHPVQDIAALHACCFSRAAFEYTYNGTDFGFHVGLDHNAYAHIVAFVFLP